MLFKNNMMRLTCLMCAVFFLSLPALSQNREDSDIALFTINKKSVSVNEFVYLYKKNHQGNKDKFTKEKIEEYLNLFINFKLKVTEAESRKMDTTDEFVKELNTYKAELRKPYVAETDVVDKLVKQAYERLGQEVKASHILIMVKQDATPADTLQAYNKIIDLRTRILAGEDFQKLAFEFSEDPSAKSNRGELGYFSGLQMVYPFEEAAFNLKNGEVSMPVRTNFGYHLIKVEDKRPSRGEVEVSHILVRGSDAQAKKTIDEVYGKLKVDGDWNESCRQYSQDQGTKDNGGRLKPFAPGALASAPKFEEVAFSMKMPGEISEPFQTSFGWHILRLENKIPLPPFTELEASLKRRVARDDRLSISKAKETERRKSQFNYKADTSLMSVLSSMADSSLVKGNWVTKPKADDKNEPLFSLNESRYGVKDFEQFILKNQSSTNLTPIVYINQLFDQFVETALEKAEDEELQQKNPEYKSLVNEYREGILLFGIMEKEVWNKASADSTGQLDYYHAHLEKYKADLRLEARIFSTPDQEFLQSIRVKMEAGDTLQTSDMKKFKSVTNFRTFEKGENKAIDKINWIVGVQETEADGMYYIVEVARLVPPGQKSFDEVRASVISDYQDYLDQKWIGELKQKYAVKINSKGKKAIAELTATQF